MEPKKLPQILSAVAACLGAMAFGAAIGFASPAGPIFLSGEGEVNLTVRENDWVSSSLTLGALFGSPVGGIVMRNIGRRMTMLGTLLPYMAGWALIIGGQNFVMLLIGRIILGLSIGVTSVVVPTYIGEISSPNIRGTLSSLFQLLVTVGVLYGYALGLVVDSFRLLAVGCAVMPLLHGVAIFFFKESPLFLVMKDRENEAADAVQFLRGKKYDIGKEMQNMTESIEEAKRNKITLAEMKQPYIMKPFIIIIFMMIFQQLSGNNAVLFNLSLIFQDAGTSLSNNVSALIIAAVQVIFTATSTILIDKLGRRILLQISAFVMTISLVGLGVFFFLKDQTDTPEETQELVDMLGWLPLTCIIFYYASFATGYGPIPWIMMGEMFFPNVKEFAASVAMCINWSCAFITTVTFGILGEAIGSYGVYWLYAAICAVNVFFSFFIVPETKGKTIEEITAAFGRTSNPTKSADAPN